MSLKVIILAGGLGTRLRGAIGAVAKPLAPVGERPFLEYVLKFFLSQGFRDLIISCGYGADRITEYFGDGSRFGLRIDYTIERELLGTGGAIKLAEPLIDSGYFFVTNGDTYFEVDLNELLDFHKERGALATMAVAYREDAGRYGRINFGEGGEIMSFEEKSKDGTAGYINGGVYVFRREVLDVIPARRVCSLETEVFPLLVGKGLYGFPAGGYFIDIGIPQDFRRANKELPLRSRK